MKNHYSRLVLPCLCFAFFSAPNAAFAQAVAVAAGDKETASTPPNSTSNFLGDRVRTIMKCTPAYKVTFGDDGNVDHFDAIGLKASTYMTGMGTTSANVPTKDGAGKPDGTTLITGEYFKVSGQDGVTGDKVPTCKVGTTLDKDDYVVVNQTDAENEAEFTRWGVVFGALTVPFKYEMTGKHDLEPSASVGPYLGWRTSDVLGTGVGVAIVGFVGASTVSIPKTTTTPATTTGGTPTTDTSSGTAAGFSYGGGFLFTIKSQFTAGVVFGYDHVDRSQNYQYSDKPWVGFQLGYTFSS